MVICSLHVVEPILNGLITFPNDFDILYEDPDELSIMLKNKLKQNGYDNVEIIKHEEIDDVIPEYIDFKLNNKTLVFIFKPIACHSYNVINIKEKKNKNCFIRNNFKFLFSFFIFKGFKL